MIYEESIGLRGGAMSTHERGKEQGNRGGGTNVCWGWPPGSGAQEEEEEEQWSNYLHWA